jgi:hypothetical protein
VLGLLGRHAPITLSISQPVSSVGSSAAATSPIQTGALDRHPRPVAATGARSRRRQRIEVASLYPTTPEPALVHARTLLAFIQDQSPQFIGKFVPQADLARFYIELCRIEGWVQCGWIAIAKELKPLTGGRKTYARRGGRRFRVYRIPRPGSSRLAAARRPNS